MFKLLKAIHGDNFKSSRQVYGWLDRFYDRESSETIPESGHSNALTTKKKLYAF